MTSRVCAVTTAAVLLGGCITTSTQAYAEYREQCQVKYQSAEGWSKSYNVECIYISGDELNFATGSFQYPSTSVYAVVFWQPHEASVIKLDDYGLCSLLVHDGCINTLTRQHSGTDQANRRWRVCQFDRFAFSQVPC